MTAFSVLIHVIPVHKGGRRGNYSVYRLVILTSVLKTLEGVLRNRILNHMESNKLMMVEQHGFGHKSLCLTNFSDVAIDRMDGCERI